MSTSAFPNHQVFPRCDCESNVNRLFPCNGSECLKIIYSCTLCKPLRYETCLELVNISVRVSLDAEYPLATNCFLVPGKIFEIPCFVLCQRRDLTLHSTQSFVLVLALKDLLVCRCVLTIFLSTETVLCFTVVQVKFSTSQIRKFLFIARDRLFLAHWPHM